MVSLRAPSRSFEQRGADGRRLWPQGVDRRALDPYYDIAERMLNVEQIGRHEIPKSGVAFAALMKNLEYSCDRALYAVKGCIGNRGTADRSPRASTGGVTRGNEHRRTAVPLSGPLSLYPRPIRGCDRVEGDILSGRSHPGMISYQFFDSLGITISSIKPLPVMMVAAAHLRIGSNGQYWGKEHVGLMKLFRRWKCAGRGSHCLTQRDSDG
jgi:hypothetical protein